MIAVLLLVCLASLHVMADKKCYDVDGYAWAYEAGKYRPANWVRVDFIELDDDDEFNPNDHIAAVNVNNDGYFQFTSACAEDSLAGNHPEPALFFCKKEEKCTQRYNLGRCDFDRKVYVQHLGNITVDQKGCAKIMPDSVIKPPE